MPLTAELFGRLVNLRRGRRWVVRDSDTISITSGERQCAADYQHQTPDMRESARMQNHSNAGRCDRFAMGRHDRAMALHHHLRAGDDPAARVSAQVARPWYR